MTRTLLIGASLILTLNSAGSLAGQPDPVAQPMLTITAATPPAAGWDLRLQVPAAVAVKAYDVEVSFQDPVDGAWKFPGLLATGLEGGNDVVLHVEPSDLTTYSSSGTQWRVRARHSAPPGPWNGWQAFAGSVAPPPDTVESSAVQRGASTSNVQAAVLRKRADVTTARTQPGAPAETARQAPAPDGAAVAIKEPELAAVALQVWDWNAITQQGEWNDHASLAQAATTQLKFRWKPPGQQDEAGHWELRAGPAGGSFATAAHVNDGLVEMPKGQGEWQEFLIDLSGYHLKGPPDRYYLVVRHMNRESPVVTVARE